ncbi:MAG: aldehyde dehydrogenase family protein [Phycisphaerales bacterium JB063]
MSITSRPDAALALPSYLCGEAVHDGPTLEVTYPWDGSLTGSVSQVSARQAFDCLQKTLERSRREPALSRYQRHAILLRVRALVEEREEELAHLIRRETGLCMKETRYEAGRAKDVFQFAAMEALKDDGEVYSCDISPQGQARKIITFRRPLSVAFAITPFNHPLNQVAHKIAPAVAAGVPMLLKPSEKTPLSAIRLCELFYEAGLPEWMLSVFVGGIGDVVEPLIRDERIPLVTFTGGTKVGKHIASIAGYKKLCLELGGNAPLIILPDAEMDLAVKLACEGNFRNSGQRCTAVKRTLVHRDIYEDFLPRFVERARAYTCGDPADEATVVGTVIDEQAAILLESRVRQAVSDGAAVLLGGGRRGAQIEPTVLRDVPRGTEMVAAESFGPLAPVIPVDDLDDAIAYANASDFGLSSAVVTNDMAAAMRCVREIDSGTTNINQVPGYRIECSPFGGVKDSGLGIKEGVVEAMKFMTNVKTFSMPW